MRFVWLAAAWLSFLAAPAFAATPTFPQLTGRVVDDAGILSPDTDAEIGSMLEQQEQQTGDQVVVVTLKSLQGYPIEDYGYQLLRHWGIGQKGKDNGALLIVAPNERKVRVEVGYGLEGQLTDAQSKLIIAEIITPAFKRGDYDGGILSGTEAILKTIGGAKIAVPAGGTSGQYQEGNRGSSGVHIPIILIIVLLWIVFGRFFWPLLFLGGGGGRGGWGGGGFGGGGFGGGGFSGGGGSGGGGGASGSW